MNILIVDDSKIIRESIQRLISPYTNGSTYYLAENVSEAIFHLNNFKFEYVILDIRMPGGSGFDVLKEAKKKTPTPKVIMLTNYATPAYRNKAAKEGADYFFDKSTDYEELIKVVQRDNYLMEKLKKVKQNKRKKQND